MKSERDRKGGWGVGGVREREQEKKRGWRSGGRVVAVFIDNK